MNAAPVEEQAAAGSATESGGPAGLHPRMLVLLCALSLSIGWGIRGNYGHEFGAMIPGALAAIAGVILSGRADWQRRIAFFGAFGAIGWAFGGSISYMQVIGYTHSGHGLSQLYGFACLFVIGFLWAAPGGAGTALPAFLNRERLTALIAPLVVVYAAWVGLEYAYEPLNLWLSARVGGGFIPGNSDFRQTEPLYWFDTDWTSALAAILAILVWCAVRRRVDEGSSLALHMALGWWAGFLLLVVALGWRMTPPRGDNWAGCLGMTLGMFAWLQRNRLPGVTLASLVTGFIGGIGFAGAALFKLVAMRSGWNTNWHSVLEQTYGLINGIGVGAAFLTLIPRAPAVSEDPPARPWADWAAPAFVLLFVTYVNMRKNVDDWVKAKAVPAALYFAPAEFWFNAAYLAVGIALVLVMIRHRQRPIALVPATWLGKGMLLYLLLLWWVVLGNFAKALPGFAAPRLVTEWVITLNAVVCSVLALLYGCTGAKVRLSESAAWKPLMRRTLVYGFAGSALIILAAWGIVRATYGDRFAGQSGKHIRFGPNATAATAKPIPGAPHP